MAAVDVKHIQEHELMLEWDSSASNDMIADSTLALITGIDKSPASVKRTNILVSQFSDATDWNHLTVTTQPHSHSHPHADLHDETSDVVRIQRLAMFLEAHFGEVELHMPEETMEPEQGEDSTEPSLLVRLDEAYASISLVSMVRSLGGSLIRN
jgi:cleavage and polyadenylation specificity factor subunit 3